MRPVLFSLFLLIVTFSSEARTIDSVITLSDSCVQIKWSPDTNNTNPVWYLQNGSLCKGIDSIYKRCDFIAGREYCGIAYSYGGEDSWGTFRSHLFAGFLVGSHQCHYDKYGDPSSIITGTDCSGFLSFVWDFSRSVTSTFYNNPTFTTVPITEVQPGDALVKATAPCGYHAVLIIENEDPTEVVISEASSVSFGCRERIVDLTSSSWACYKAIRYPKLVKTSTKTTHATAQNILVVDINQKQSGLLRLNFAPGFSGKICGYLPDGKLLFKKNVTQNESVLNIETTPIRTNILLVEISTTTQSLRFVARITSR
jgi:hypothetical protein